MLFLKLKTFKSSMDILTKKLAFAVRSIPPQEELTEIGKVKLKLTNSLIFKLVYSVQSYEIRSVNQIRSAGTSFRCWSQLLSLKNMNE